MGGKLNLFAALISLIPTPESADEGAASLFLPPIYPFYLFINVFVYASLFAPAYVLQMLVFRLALSPSRAPEPRPGGGEEGRPVAVGRSGHHVGGRAAV